MKRLLASFAAAFVAFTSSAYAEPVAGYDRLDIKAAHRAAPIAASLWYPLSTPTYTGLVGENAIFKGTPASIGAAIAEGKFPLIVLSHGSGSSMDGMAWLGSALALRGAVVLGLNHPGTTSNDSSPRRTLKLDERAADLHAALDTILANSDFAPHIDSSKITALGFSLGGAAVLGDVGVRFDRAKYRDYCTRMPEQADCTFLAKGGVDFANLPEGFEANMRDPRVTSIIAVDPAMTYAIADKSLETLRLPMLLVNLGGDERPLGINLTAKGSNLIGKLPEATYTVIAAANHFTFLPECKPGARAVLAEANEDAICDDPAGVDRARTHQEIVERIAGFLGLK